MGARQIGQKVKSLPQSQHVCKIYRNKLEMIRKHVDVNPGFDFRLPDVHIPMQDLFDSTNTQDNSAYKKKKRTMTKSELTSRGYIEILCS